MLAKVGKELIPHSTRKCNTCGFEDFPWCFESEAFPRPVVEPALNRENLVLGVRSKVRLHEKEPSDETDDILRRAALQAMVGLPEPGTGAQDAVGAQMLGVLGAIVVADGASHGFRHTAQPSCEGNTHLPRALLAE